MTALLERADELTAQHMDWATSIARKVAKGMPPSIEAADLIQIALFKTWQKAQEYDPSTGVPFSAFAFHAVRGECLMACRRRHYRNSTHQELTEHHDPPVPAPQCRELHRKAIAALMGTLLDTLPGGPRAMLEGYYIRGEATADVALQMGVSVEAARLLRRQGLMLLRQEAKLRGLSAAGLEPPAA